MEGKLEKYEGPVEVGQIFASKYTTSDGEPLRRIRILAQYPNVHGDDVTWIYEDLPAAMTRLHFYELRRCPDFNLRYTMRPEETHEQTS